MKTFLLLLVFLVAGKSFAVNEVVNGDELRARVGTSAFAGRDLSAVKVAVLDNGFRGYAPGKGMLPASAELVEGPLKFPEMTSHGLGMAQVLWEASGRSAAGPKFYLINANGFTNFKAAVDFVIKNKIDIVLYAQVWTFGSNWDGKGFINASVNRAVNAGVIWINAAGNLGGLVANGDVGDGEIELVNKLDDNSFTVTLTWDDFAESETVCTLKDLDLELIDAEGSVVSASTLDQVGASPDPKDPSDKRSCYARESFSVRDLSRGSYQLRIVNKNRASGRFRVLVTEARPGSVEIPGAHGSEIMPPADNPSVLTVGEKTPFGATGPTADGRMKPEVLVENALVAFTNGTQTAGTSNAAAMVAGAVAVIRSMTPDFSREKLLAYATSLRAKVVIPAGLVKVPAVSPWVSSLLPRGGVVRQDPGTYRLVILSYEHPTTLPQLAAYHLRVRRSGDIVACLENMTFCRVFPQEEDYDIRPPFIEFRQYKNAGVMNEAPLWRMP